MRDPFAAVPTQIANLDDRYRLLEKIGHGGMADVFLAVRGGPHGFRKVVVVKQLKRSLLSDDAMVALFWEEARLAARFDHPNVVRIHEVGECEGLPFIAMEYLAGQSLSALRRHLEARSEAARLASLPQQIAVLAGILRGLHYVHELADFDATPLGIVHRDISPHNVIVSFDGEVKILDFGIATTAASTPRIGDGVRGTFAYMAPEQARAEPIDRRADVFAVGVMLWEALHGARLWNGMNYAAIFQELVADRLPALTEEPPPGVPEQLLAVCTRSLSAEREARFESAEAMRHALENALPSLGEAMSNPCATAALMAELFVEERQRVNHTISAHLRFFENIELPAPAGSDRADAARISEPGPWLRTADTSQRTQRVEPARPRWFSPGRLLAAGLFFLTVAATVLGAVTIRRDAEPAAELASIGAMRVLQVRLNANRSLSTELERESPPVESRESIPKPRRVEQPSPRRAKAEPERPTSLLENGADVENPYLYR